MITITLTPGAQKAIVKLKKSPELLAPALMKAMDLENEFTVGYIQQKKLSKRGPNTLGVVTNRLRSSLRPTRSRISNGAIIASIGSNVRYAGAHEFGFNGSVTVKAHTRKLKSSGTTVTVKTHSRVMNIKKRAPIRTGIEERERKYANSISKVLEELMVS